MYFQSRKSFIFSESTSNILFFDWNFLLFYDDTTHKIKQLEGLSTLEKITISSHLTVTWVLFCFHFIK